MSAVCNLPDRVYARYLFAAGSAAGALANALIPMAGSAAAVLALRFATGAALACVYPPRLKIAAGWFRHRRGTALGVAVGALTIGSAFPHLLASAAADVAWRPLIWSSSILALAGGALRWRSWPTGRISPRRHRSTPTPRIPDTETARVTGTNHPHEQQRE